MGLAQGGEETGSEGWGTVLPLGEGSGSFRELSTASQPAWVGHKKYQTGGNLLGCSQTWKEIIGFPQKALCLHPRARGAGRHVSRQTSFVSIMQGVSCFKHPPPGFTLTYQCAVTWRQS